MVLQILCSQEKGGPEESAYGRGLASAVCRAAELTGSLRSLSGVRAGKLALVAVVDPGPQFECALDERSMFRLARIRLQSAIIHSLLQVFACFCSISFDGIC